MKTTSRRTCIAIAAICMPLMLLFSSCVDLSTEIELNTDGSGTIRLSYTAPRAVVNLGTIDEGNRFYALPISEEDFLTTTGKVDGLSLESFTLDEEVDTLHIVATLDFETIEALSALFSSTGPGAIEIIEEGENRIFRHIIYGGSGDEVDADSRELIETFFSEDSVTLSLKVPGEIRSVNIGTSNGREANAELPMTEILFSRQQVIWEVRW
jgi:hypothetical protein